jgi:Holliday junction resolvase RusA-like endonuclease
MSGPIRLDLTFFMPRPKSEPTAYWMSKRPDKDNLAQVIMDALTKAGWWHDDGQVCSGWINKRYPPEGGSVGVEIMAEEIE